MAKARGKKKILLFGATGTIGRAVLAELNSQGNKVVCVIRPGSAGELSTGTLTVEADVTDADAMRAVFTKDTFDAVISCMASRSGDRKSVV